MIDGSDIGCGNSVGLSWMIEKLSRMLRCSFVLLSSVQCLCVSMRICVRVRPCMCACSYILHVCARVKRKLAAFRMDM